MTNSKRNHMIDFLFPLAVLFVFAVSAISVLLFATNIYSESVDNSSRNSVARTSISYISEKVHQNDEDGKIYASKLDGSDALVLGSKIDGQEYLTYIYASDGELREIFTKEGFEVSKEQGSKLLELQEMKVEKINNRIYKIECVDAEGKSASTVVGIRS